MQNKDYVIAGGALIIGLLCGLLVSYSTPHPVLDCMDGMTGVYLHQNVKGERLLDTVTPVSCTLDFDK